MAWRVGFAGPGPGMVARSRLAAQLAIAATLILSCVGDPTLMPLYTFHAFKADGAPLLLSTEEASGDGAAHARAAAILTDHQSAAQVEIWCDARFVGERRICAAGA